MADQYNSAFTGAEIDAAIQSVKDNDGKLVKVTEQSLTDEQKAQARTNIGAGTSNVELAANLTTSGKAADAKVTGDAIASAKEAAFDAGCSSIVAGNGACTQSVYDNYRKIIAGEAILENFVHVSDKVPTMDDLKKGFSIVMMDDPLAVIECPPMNLEESVFNECVVSVDNHVTVIINDYIIIVDQDNYTLNDEFTFPYKGVYVSYPVVSFRVNGFSFDEGGGSDYFEEVTETADLGDTVTWDGDESWRDSYIVDSGSSSGIRVVYVKVCDSILAPDDFANGGNYGFLYNEKSYIIELTTDDLSYENGVLTLSDDERFISGSANALNEAGYSVASSGTYFIKQAINSIGDTLYTSSLTVNGYNFTYENTIEIIKQEHLPEALRFGEFKNASDTLTWDGTTEGLVYGEEDEGEYGITYYYKLSDAMPSADELVTGKYTYYVFATGELGEEDIVGVDTSTLDGAIIAATNTSIACVVCTSPNKFLPETGVYVAYNETSGIARFVSFTIPGYNGFITTEVVPIDEKYLPDAAVKNGDTSITLASPGGKKFTITVSDDGVLTATEVTE